jgi:alpha-tubulin suppressor-like RCC1 family protein
MDSTNVPVPSDVPDIKHKCVKVACGYDHTLVVLRDGQVWGAGAGGGGELGVSPEGEEATFCSNGMQINVRDEGEIVKFSAVASRGQHSVMLSTHGEVWTSGWNTFG